jgi:V-type H+-transporting ATPase subunit C
MDKDATSQQPVFKVGNYVDFAEKFKAAAREKRFIVRDFKPTDKVVDSKDELAELDVQVAEKKTGLQRWCRTHFGEAFGAWIHLKVIRAFVESVLRYGLSPVMSEVKGERPEQQANFVLAVLRVAKNKGSQLQAALDKLVPQDAANAVVDEGDEGEYHPYCKLEFTVS